MKRQWQARFRNWVGGSKYGVLCVGVRRRGRGEWLPPAEAPEAVREFLFLKKTPGSHWCCEDFHTVADMQAGAQNATCRLNPRLGLLVAFEIDEPARGPRLLPIHSLCRQLARTTGRDSLAGICRAVYKRSACGVSMGFLLDGQWVYDSSLPSEPLADTLKSHIVTGVKVCGYVEGWDGELQPVELVRTKGERLTEHDFWKAVEQADDEANEIWNETHGCEDCDTTGEFGNKPIDPNCETCKGQGTIL